MRFTVIATSLYFVGLLCYVGAYLIVNADDERMSVFNYFNLALVYVSLVGGVWIRYLTSREYESKRGLIEILILNIHMFVSVFFTANSAFMLGHKSYFNLLISTRECSFDPSCLSFCYLIILGGIFNMLFSFFAGDAVKELNETKETVNK